MPAALETTVVTRRLKLGILASHPIQYQAPLFRELATRCDLHVYFAHRQTPQAQAAAGFGVAFEWDVDLLSGYTQTFLPNVDRLPDTSIHKLVRFNSWQSCCQKTVLATF